MEVTIQQIKIYNDGIIEMVVCCNKCKNINCHTITHASTKIDDKIIIDFSKLDKRCCHNFEMTKKQKTYNVDYKLYI
jgi:hypothetical protein